MKHDLEHILLNKILDLNAAKNKVITWQAEGQKVVFTNGVFDLLHIGHITYLAKAADLGNKLVIGLNADSSVKRIKGDDEDFAQAETGLIAPQKCFVSFHVGDVFMVYMQKGMGGAYFLTCNGLERLEKVDIQNEME